MCLLIERHKTWEKTVISRREVKCKGIILWQVHSFTSFFKSFFQSFWSSWLFYIRLCSHEIKRCLLFGRKVMTNLDSIFKSRDITLPTKVRLVKAMVFPVVMYGCESWTIKKAEHWRIDVFELWCLRTLDSPLDCRDPTS